MKFKSIYCFLIVSLFFSSCGTYNRMTPPEVLKQEERIFTVAAAVEPLRINEIATFAIQPVIGYRTGLGDNKEIGITMYGILPIGFVIDLKHQIYQEGNFIISGDLAVSGRKKSLLGLQYDLLMGNHNLYGVIGFNLNSYKGDFVPIVTLGLGKEFGTNREFGLQIVYARGFNSQTLNNLSIGLKMDFPKIKKKYRTVPE